MDAPHTGRYGTASPAPDGLRVGDAERDEVAAALREHYAQGRLDRDEFDERLERALPARTHADLRALLADLPDPSAARPGAGPATAEPRPEPWDRAWDDSRRAWQDACARAWATGRHPAWRHGGHHAPWGPPWAHRPHRHRHRHHHHVPFPLALFAGLGVVSLVAGTAWPLIAALKIWVIFMIVAGVAAIVHHRHHHRHR